MTDNDCDDGDVDDDDGGFDDMDGTEWHRGTSLCTGDCRPMCDWCLAAHECPMACGGGDACPYVGLERGRA